MIRTLLVTGASARGLTGRGTPHPRGRVNASGQSSGSARPEVHGRRERVATLATVREVRGRTRLIKRLGVWRAVVPDWMLSFGIPERYSRVSRAAQKTGISVTKFVARAIVTFYDGVTKLIGFGVAEGWGPGRRTRWEAAGIAVGGPRAAPGSPARRPAGRSDNPARTGIPADGAPRAGRPSQRPRRPRPIPRFFAIAAIVCTISEFRPASSIRWNKGAVDLQGVERESVQEAQ